MDPDGTNRRRLTENTGGDSGGVLSPDGKRIVFDSNRNRAAGEPLNTFDLFLMKVDGSDQTLLTRGSSATWSPDSKFIAYHASASGTLPPIRPDPGAPAADSDIFVARVGALLDNEAPPINITNSPDDIEEDADWSPDGQTIVYTRHPASDQPANFNYTSKEIYVLNADGTAVPLQLTVNAEEERAPAWSPDGKSIAYNCRKGPLNAQGNPTFRICIMNADGTGQTQLTFGLGPVSDLGPHWSPDGTQMVFVRPVAGQGQQIFVMNADGTGEQQLTTIPGINAASHWGEVKTNCAEDN